jgi:thiamine biosynthesis lipoprotein
MSRPHLVWAAAAVIPVLLGAAALPGPGRDVVWVEREAFVMGTRLRIRLAAAEREAGFAGAEAALERIRAVEDLLSTWRHDTELARLNAAPPAAWVGLSPRLSSLLAEVRGWHAATDGAFDPAVGALIDAWGLRGEGRLPSEAELAAARGATGLDRFMFDDAGGAAARSSSRAWIDAGGFGKGAGLRQALSQLEAMGIGDALLDFGGQLAVRGSGPDGRGWPVAVAHPARRGEVAARLLVSDRSVATTSQSERYVEADGKRYGHVMDPRTGTPVAPWGSVTVVARDPLDADALSTALFVMGPEAGLRWVRDRDDLGALFLIQSEGRLEARWNRAMDTYLTGED